MKIKIALVIDEKGDYSAMGWPSGMINEGKLCFDTCLDGLMGEGSIEKKYIVNVEVPLPKLEEIEGTIEDV